MIKAERWDMPFQIHDSNLDFCLGVHPNGLNSLLEAISIDFL